MWEPHEKQSAQDQEEQTGRVPLLKDFLILTCDKCGKKVGYYEATGNAWEFYCLDCYKQGRVSLLKVYITYNIDGAVQAVHSNKRMAERDKTSESDEVLEHDVIET